MTQAEFTLSFSFSLLFWTLCFKCSDQGRKEIRSWQIGIKSFEEEPLMPWRATDHEP